MYPYIHIFGRNIGTYGLCMTVGIVTVAALAMVRGKSRGLLMEDLLIVAAFAIGCGLLGGSLLYVFVTYSPEQIRDFIQQRDFRFLSSGIVFYGGLLGGIAGTLMGIRVAGCGLGPIERSVVPLIPLGHGVGRIGCVLAGCCHGFAYDGPFALFYPNSVAGLSPDQGFFPVQLLESLVNMGLCLFLLRYEKRTKQVTQLLYTYLGLYAVARYFLEMLRGDAVRGIWNSISTSQIISLVLIGVSIVGLSCQKKRGNKKEAPLA